VKNIFYKRNLWGHSSLPQARTQRTRVARSRLLSGAPLKAVDALTRDTRSSLPERTKGDIKKAAGY
jgi:hypothetical protein